MTRAMILGMLIVLGHAAQEARVTGFAGASDSGGSGAGSGAGSVIESHGGARHAQAVRYSDPVS